MKLYGNVTPPLYNLRKITSPVILFFGPNDDLGTIKVKKYFTISQNN